MLFLLSPEKAHNFSTRSFGILNAIPLVGSIVRKMLTYENSNLQKSVFGIDFPNPVGLAAGFDKDGKYINSFSKLGFGFYEVGTVTPLGQIGNDKPRLFRLPEDEALINRMGFNNSGVDILVQSLKDVKNRKDIIIGGNIGKNKLTPNERAVDDYLICFKKLFDYVDYFVVNVSSPNTPGLRSLQEKGPLSHILNTLQRENAIKGRPKPILLKIAPDLTDGQLDDIIEIVQETKLAGLIATNTTIERNLPNSPAERIKEIGNGGLSGKPVADRSTEVIKYISQKTQGAIPIIGVGGINSAAEAQKKLDAGASLVQIYSALVYEGPFLVKRIKKSLAKV